jgi:hypothetical protein
MVTELDNLAVDTPDRGTPNAPHAADLPNEVAVLFDLDPLIGLV